MKTRFHSVDTLRFFAFLKVFMLHIPVQAEGMYWLKLLKGGGGIGVFFFFVLSGFLITFILLREKKEDNQINVFRFLKHRALRTFPLFYLAVLFALFFPEPFATELGFRMIGGGYEPNFWTSVGFLENYQMIIHDNFPRNTPLVVFWSLCIEEHFYLLWVIVAAILPMRFFLRFLVFSVLLSPFIRQLYAVYIPNQMIKDNDLFTNLDLFAFGGILAYFVANEYEKVCIFINNISLKIKYLYLILVVLIVVFEKEISNITGITPIFKPCFLGFLFAAVIAIFIPQDSQIRFKENGILNRFGQMSYGLYVYHIIIIHTLFQYCITNNILLDNYLYIFIFSTLSFILSYSLSYISYHYFEMPILKFKNK